MRAAVARRARGSKICLMTDSGFLFFPVVDLAAATSVLSSVASATRINLSRCDLLPHLEVCIPPLAHTCLSAARPAQDFRRIVSVCFSAQQPSAFKVPAAGPAHTEVTVRTLADSACLKRLFRSCMLGDFGRGMRGERLFSVTPLEEDEDEEVAGVAGGCCLASWQHSLWKALCTWL